MTFHSFNPFEQDNQIQSVSITFQYNELTKSKMKEETKMLIRMINSILVSSEKNHLIIESKEKLLLQLENNTVDNLLISYFCIELDMNLDRVKITQITPFITNSITPLYSLN